MGNIVVIAVLAVVVIVAAVSAVRHFRGEGGCCGGCCDKPERKKLSAPKIGEKRVLIEGMECDHCKNSVEREINRIDGAAARVNLVKKTAVVEMSRSVGNDEIAAAVERAGFKAVSIEG